MRQDFTEFQASIQADLDKQRSQVDEAFQGFATRFNTSNEFDGGFRESVAEHLKLARDEGARLSATAYAEAEKLDAPAAAPANYAGLRDAIADITSKDSQSAILKALVEHASEFAPRGAFFIIKNEHFAGWKVFGNEAGNTESAIRDIHFPTSADSILGRASSSRSTAESSYGAHSEDAAFLAPLDLGQPDRMYAIPLLARGRGVAVMYADQGSEGGPVNLEALETLVSVAGLTVELLASAQTAKAEHREMEVADFEDARHEVEETEDHSAAAVAELPAEPHVSENEPEEFAFSDSVSVQSGFSEASTPEPAYETIQPAAEAPQIDPEPVQEFEASDDAMLFDSGGSIEPAGVADASPFETAVEPFQPAGAIGGGGMNSAFEPAVEVAAQPVPQARLSDRPVDLPIDVPEEERRLHNDARRFARLLVSEIKLYNEKKVLEGRQAHDLYDRLREAIDRSREMYDKRVQPPVAARFDYFHYELLNSLAEGDVARFGSGYPGATV